jgi:hypothetical protein
VNFTSHNEESDLLAYHTNLSHFNTSREYVRQLAEVISSKGAKWNFQSDWKFLEGVVNYDSGTSTTNNKNIIRWLKEDKGFEIDPHAHETTRMYPDVAKLMVNLGITPSGVVGGFIYDNTRWHSLRSPEAGSYYGSYSWTAEILWGAGSASHTADENSYGIWKPKSATEFSTHDSAATLVHVGGGCANVVGATTTASEIANRIIRMVDGIKNGTYSAAGIYTANIQLNQRDFNAAYINQASEIIDLLAPYVSEGSVVWKNIGEKRDMWVAGGGAPFRLQCPYAD